MKTFNQYNESIRDILKPKSEEDIRKTFLKMDIFDRIKLFDNNKLPDQYFPTKEEITEQLKKDTASNIFLKIHKLKLEITDYFTKDEIKNLLKKLIDENKNNIKEEFGNFIVIDIGNLKYNNYYKNYIVIHKINYNYDIYQISNIDVMIKCLKKFEI